VIQAQSRDAPPIACKKITSACSRPFIQRYQVSWGARQMAGVRGFSFAYLSI
jgi:hypothetical protein